jgi:hypothetical protein
VSARSISGAGVGWRTPCASVSSLFFNEGEMDQGIISGQQYIACSQEYSSQHL